jgi:hypothetical protein
VIFRRRSRFAQVVDSQLALFGREQAGLLAEVSERLRAYDRTGRESAEEAFGDYVDVRSQAAEALEEMRDAYALTLDDPDEYVDAFDRSARRRFPGLSAEFDAR